MTDPLWHAVHTERARLAEDLAGLTEAEWSHPTLCDRWDVRHVVAHLTAAATTGRAAWLRSMALAGFRPDVHNERRLREHLGSSPAQTLEAFRSVIGSTVAPTRDTAAWLGEVVVHAEVIRAPLGLAGVADIPALTAVAEFYAARDFAVDSRRIAQGLRLEAGDGPFRHGDGPSVTGPTLSVLMAMAGRASHLSRLRGEGVALLADRIG